MKDSKSLAQWLEESIQSHEKRGSNFPFSFMIIPSYRPPNPLFPFDGKTAETYITYHYDAGFWSKKWYHKPKSEDLNLTSDGISDLTIEAVAKIIKEDVGQGLYEVSVNHSSGYLMLEKVSGDENIGSTVKI